MHVHAPGWRGVGGTTSPWSCSEGSRLPGLEGWLLSAAKLDINKALRERVKKWKELPQTSGVTSRRLRTPSRTPKGSQHRQLPAPGAMRRAQGLVGGRHELGERRAARRHRHAAGHAGATPSVSASDLGCYWSVSSSTSDGIVNRKGRPAAKSDLGRWSFHFSITSGFLSRTT